MLVLDKKLGMERRAAEIDVGGTVRQREGNRPWVIEGNMLLEGRTKQSRDAR